MSPNNHIHMNVINTHLKKSCPYPLSVPRMTEAPTSLVHVKYAQTFLLSMAQKGISNCLFWLPRDVSKYEQEHKLK